MVEFLEPGTPLREEKHIGYISYLKTTSLKMNMCVKAFKFDVIAL